MNAVARLLAATPAAPADLESGTRPPSSVASSGGGISRGGARGLYVRFLVAAIWPVFITAASNRHAHGGMLGYFVVAVAVVAVAFSVAVPIIWLTPPRRRIWVVSGFLATTFILWPALGWDVMAMWVLVGALIGICMFTTVRTALVALILTAAAVAFEYFGGETSTGITWLPAVIWSVAMMISGFSRQRAAIAQLRATRHELAALAVEQERGRVARDIHDILGHSLTAITVKAELTGMLIDADRPAEARTEVTAVEELARGALADVRSTVAGYRGVTVTGELAGARAMLESAGIRADLPPTIDELPARMRELAGWVIREGVTNVVRHSDAENCRITIDADGVEVADDGNGPATEQGTRPETDEQDGRSDGNGLRGLRERATALGCAVLVGRSDLGGFSLRLNKGPSHE